MELKNHTPFIATSSVLFDDDGGENLIIVLKSTWSISETGELSVAENQFPIQTATEYYGEPGQSSLKYEPELSPVKQSTDVFLIGNAIAPGKNTTEMYVEFRVGSMKQSAVVFGKRVWKNSVFRSSISNPEPFDAVPLIYENAFGGTDMSPKKERYHGFEKRNPVGKGYRSKRSKVALKGQPLPQIEAMGDYLKKPGTVLPPVGFGPVDSTWQPRSGYAGTYDQEWIDEIMPLMPDDFDKKFYNSAPPALIADGYLKGGEPVEVRGCTPSGHLRFKLPELNPRALIRICDRYENIELHCNSVTVDTERMELHLLFKNDLSVDRELLKVRKMDVFLKKQKTNQGLNR